MKARGGATRSVLLVLAMAVVGSALLFSAGCHKSSGDDDANAVGTWVMTYDWGCNGTSATTVWHLHSNGSMIDEQGSSGNWSVSGNTITVNYSNGTAYSGTVENDSYMSGTMTSIGTGTRGCWSAALRSRNASVLPGAVAAPAGMSAAGE